MGLLFNFEVLLLQVMENYNFIMETPPWRKRAGSHFLFPYCWNRSVRPDHRPHEFGTYVLELPFSLEFHEERTVRSQGT